MLKTSIASDDRMRARAVPVIACFEDDLKDKPFLARAGKATSVDLKKYFKLKGFRGTRNGSFEVLNPGRKRPRVLVWGLGSRKKADAQSLWKSGLKLFKHLKGEPATDVALMVNFCALDPAIRDGCLAAFVDAAQFSTFRYDKFRKKPSRKALAGLQILTDGTPKPAEARKLVRERLVYGEAVNLARSMIVEPGSELPPALFAERIAEHLAGTGVDVKIHKPAGMKRLKLNGVLAVGRGSVNEPRYVEMAWKGNPESGEWLGLVGKGVTFDTGGISLKRPQGMWKMKYDMSGAAAVFGAMLALAKLNAPVNVRAVTPLVENKPGGNSFLPGDVITYANGLSVEVISTDAEGRLILADGICHLSSKPEIRKVVSIATLTGAVTVSLGRDIMGSFSRHEGLVDDLKAAALRSGELVWPLPMHEPYGDLLKSDCADLKNGGDGTAGSILAAMLLDRFCDDSTQLLHLDIAGVAWLVSSAQTGGGDATPRGAGVRLLAELARRLGG
jgi:leucyl aminopeptidase